MALNDGIQLIISQMEKERKEIRTDLNDEDASLSQGLQRLDSKLGDWISMLHVMQAVSQPAKTNEDNLKAFGCNPQGPKNAEVKRMERHVYQEDTGPLTVYIAGGPLDCTMTIIDSKMPMGAKTLIDGVVHILGEDRQLHYSEKDTNEIREQRTKG